MPAAAQKLPAVPPWVQELSDRYPLRFKGSLQYAWQKAYQEADRTSTIERADRLTAAQSVIKEIDNRSQARKVGSLSLVASDSDIIEWAAKTAEAMARTDTATAKRADVAHCVERRFVLMAQALAKLGIEPPMPTAEIDEAGCIARMTCARWLRRQARRQHMRRVELVGRDLGLVRKQTGCYASDEVVKRVAERNAHNTALLETLVAESNHGDEVAMSAIREQSIANPKNRFAETIVRVKGLEALAKKHGDQCDFVTLTAPSRFHAYMNKTGLQNPLWVEAGRPDVRDANAWLQTVWQRVRAAVKRAGIPNYWFRVSEAHHDGCPHWHLMVWTPSPFARNWLRAIFEGYALEEEYNLVRMGEGKAREKAKHLLKNKDRRILFKGMDSEEGGAAGYCVKYLAKHLSADKLNNDLLDPRAEEYGQDPLEVLNRVQAWASCWGIRQFQFNGAGVMGLWREFRRLGDTRIAHTQLERLRLAADASQFDQFVELLGGRYAVAADYPVRLKYSDPEEGGLYGDMQRRVVGLETADGQFSITTRIKRWEILPDEQPRKIAFTALGDCGANRVGFGVGVGMESNAFSRASVESVSSACGGRVFLGNGHADGVVKKICSRPRSAAALSGAAATPWTCVNNCTEGKNEPTDKSKSTGGESQPENQKSNDRCHGSG